MAVDEDGGDDIAEDCECGDAASDDVGDAGAGGGEAPYEVADELPVLDDQPTHNE